MKTSKREREIRAALKALEAVPSPGNDILALRVKLMTELLAIVESK